MASNSKATSFRSVKVRGHFAQKSCNVDACAALHPLGQKNLLVCKGCKLAAYCSKSCQKIDWPNHKPVCHFQHQQITHNADIMTSTGLTVEELTRILYDFKALHFSSISAVIHSRIFHAGGVRSFPYASQAMVFQLSYRMDCCGNPALAFRIESATLLPRSALDEDARDAIEASKRSTEAIKVRRRAEQPDFVDILPVMFSLRRQRVIEPFAIHDQLSLLQHGLKGPDFFLEQLRVLSERGHAYRDVGVGELVLGQMKERDNKWHWVALTKEEAEAGGYVSRADFVEGDDES